MERLPIHGFVLAGGKSSRMGRDKALLEFRGRPLIEIAVEKLMGFCAEVSIAGNRDDLARFGPVVPERRLDAGPAAGVEAGLLHTRQPWAMFLPVDVPMVPTELLQLWVSEALRVKMSVSYLMSFVTGAQPVFCMLQRERLPTFSQLLDAGERRLEPLLNLTAQADECASWAYDERELYGHIPEYCGPDDATLERWFTNLNTPEDIAAAERREAAFDRR